MQFIKLDATTSTNAFIKELIQLGKATDQLVVTANYQTAGRGQLGTSWQAEPGKNIIMSTLYKYELPADQLFVWNAAVALAAATTLQHFEIPDIQIKWPNDILSDKLKVAGILIENIFKADGTVWSIIGIGLNVNQVQFEQLPKATSMANQTQTAFDLELVLQKLVDQMAVFIEKAKTNSSEIWALYHQLLYGKNQWMSFTRPDHSPFIAFVLGVTERGMLQLRHEDDNIELVELKQVGWDL
ncbi:MAG: biotin--[acetyl-CoA-carboxylase] ligase [Flavobacterium sp. BFFFF2]|nr:MAG: biotin--[acetyl-CoA-carboxylase] ligase [Flavobacterium sp. BFFFF2]